VGLTACLIGADGKLDGLPKTPLAPDGQDDGVIMKDKTCSSCEQELTDASTATYGGFDGSSYATANRFGKADRDWFTKCDDCFEADIDRHLERVLE
jgi:hypothetical protein